MRILKATRFKQCKDGTVMNEFVLDEEVTSQFIDYLSGIGEVRLMKDMEPPFYSFTVPGFFTMKGIVSETSTHVKFRTEVREPGNEIFQILIDQYAPSGVDLDKVRECMRKIRERAG